MSSRRYGWIPSPPDHRDRLYAAATPGELPPSVDLRTRTNSRGAPLLGTPWQQGRLNTCQTHAAGKAWFYTLGLEGLTQVTPSRLFVYYNGRAYEDWQGADVGAYNRDVVKGLAQYGAPPEKQWPYTHSKVNVKPPAEAYANAEKRVALEYLSVPQDADAIKTSLAEGYPVIIGFTMYDGSMPTKENGFYQALPTRNNSVVGRHAVLIVGYRTINRHPAWIVLDSDGSWLNGGYWFLAEKYLTDPSLSTDFWTLRKVR